MILRRIGTAIARLDWTVLSVEFLVLVAGVFVGLQVDDWNNRRLERLGSYDSLVRLNEELQLQVQTYEGRIANAQRWRTHVEYLDEVLQHPERARSDPARLPLAILLSTYQSDFPIPVRTYEELESGGKIEHIQNPELIKMIRSHYLGLAMWQVVSERTEYVSERYSQTIVGLLDIPMYRALLTDVDWENPVMPWFTSDQAVALASAASESSDMRKWLPTVYWYHTGTENLANEQIELISHLRSEISRELASRNLESGD